MTPVKVFVAEAGNEFMKDIAAWIVEAFTESGRPASIVQSALPQDDGHLNLVVAPHEFFELFDAPCDDVQLAVTRSVCISTEQPGTPWFELTVDACRRAQFVLDINRHGVDELRARGIETDHLQLGAVPSMTAPTVGNERPIDVLFMGGLDDRRGRVLADLAPVLARRRSDIRLFTFDQPVGSSTPGVVFGRAKYELLASAKVLLNIHRGRSTEPGAAPPAHYFEWARMIEAMANRCVVVSETSEGHAPLRAGVDFIGADADGLTDAIEWALDGKRGSAMAESAFDTVTGNLALSRGLPAMIAELESGGVIGPNAPGQRVRRTDRWLLGASRKPAPPRLGPLRPVADLQRRAKQTALAETTMLRRIDEMECLLRHGAPQWLTTTTTPAVDLAPHHPDVSAIVTLYDYERVVEDALASLAASTGVDIEIIVVDDHSTDSGRAVVLEFMQHHPDVAITLLAKDANEGLAAARNQAFSHARGRHVFVIDADNEVYPRCLERLSATLDANPRAAASYSILEDFGNGRGVRSALAWDVERLCVSNYIDAQAMWRSDAWEQLGGYRADDEHVHGWEDWDLWLRLAATGGHAVLCTEIQGRYRVQESSMISLTNLETDLATAAIRGRYPALPWPADSP